MSVVEVRCFGCRTVTLDVLKLVRTLQMVYDWTSRTVTLDVLKYTGDWSAAINTGVEQ